MNAIPWQTFPLTQCEDISGRFVLCTEMCNKKGHFKSTFIVLSEEYYCS